MFFNKKSSDIASECLQNSRSQEIFHVLVVFISASNPHLTVWCSSVISSLELILYLGFFFFHSPITMRGTGKRKTTRSSNSVQDIYIKKIFITVIMQTSSLLHWRITIMLQFCPLVEKDYARVVTSFIFC